MLSRRRGHCKSRTARTVAAMEQQQQASAGTAAAGEASSTPPAPTRTRLNFNRPWLYPKQSEAISDACLLSERAGAFGGRGMTCTACHAPPAGVWILRLLSSRRPRVPTCRRARRGPGARPRCLRFGRGLKALRIGAAELHARRFAWAKPCLVRSVRMARHRTIMSATASNI